MRLCFSLLLPRLLWVWDMRSTSPQKRFVICGFAGFCSAAAQVFSFSQNFLGGHLLKHREILSCCHQQSCKVPFQEGIFRRIFFLEETLIRKRGKLCKTTFFEEFFSTSATTVKHSKWDYFPNNLLSLEREKKSQIYYSFFLGLWSSQILTYFSTYGNRLKIWHHGYFFPLMTTPRNS